MADFADDVALLSGNGCCRVDRIACAGVENRGKKRKSTKRCGLDRLNLIYAKRAVTHPINGLIRYPRLVLPMLRIYLSFYLYTHGHTHTHMQTHTHTPRERERV